MAERLKLVTDFAELRTGMIVIGRGCMACGKDHRGMLMSPGNHIVAGVGATPGFDLVPLPPCAPKAGFAVIPSDVAARQVYIVDDGLEAPADSLAKNRRTPARVP